MLFRMRRRVGHFGHREPGPISINTGFAFRAGVSVNKNRLLRRRSKMDSVMQARCGIVWPNFAYQFIYLNFHKYAMSCSWTDGVHRTASCHSRCSSDHTATWLRPESGYFAVHSAFCIVHGALAFGSHSMPFARSFISDSAHHWILFITIPSSQIIFSTLYLLCRPYRSNKKLTCALSSKVYSGLKNSAELQTSASRGPSIARNLAEGASQAQGTKR